MSSKDKKSKKSAKTVTPNMTTSLALVPVDIPAPIVSLAEHRDGSPRVAALSSTGKAPGLGATSATGVVHYGGMIYYQDEKDRAWSDQFARDETIREMQNNPILGGVLRQIAMFIRQVKWQLDPADDSDEAKKIRDYFQRQLDGMRNQWPGGTMPQILTYLAWGWATLEIMYKVFVDEDGVKRFGWDQWRLIPQETRWKWVFDESTGEATHIVQLDVQNNKEIPIPLFKCIHIRDTSRNNSPEGFTLFRIVYDAYFYRSGFQQLEGSLFERYGGVQVARLPGDDIENKSPAYLALQQIVATLGVNSQTGLILASDKDPTTNEYIQDFEIVAPASGATVPSADPIINRYANEMVGVYGAAVTRTGQDGSGSYALADVQSEVFLQNMTAYLDNIQDAIFNQAFIPLANMPYNQFPMELMPKLSHGKLDKIALKDLGTYITSLAQSGELQDSAELRVWLAQQAQLPVGTVEEVQAQMDKEKAEADALQQQQMELGVAQAKAASSSQDSSQKGTKVGSQKGTATPQNLKRGVDPTKTKSAG